MPNDTQTQVPSEEQTPVSTTPETQGLATSAAQAAPVAPQTDADVQALKQKLEQYELDIRQLKSTSDRKLNEATKEWQRKEEELRRQTEEAKLSVMDEDARGKYLREREVQHVRELEDKASKASNIETEYQASLGAIKHFTSLGVPLSTLVTDKGYDALFQSGYQFMVEDYAKLKTTGKQTPPPPPTAPSVSTQSGTVPNLKATWADLIKVYGSAEAVYRGVESGRLDPSIIPE